MSQERKRNMAVRGIQNVFDDCNSLDVPRFDGFEFAEDFVYVDLRTGGANFGTLDGSGLKEMLASAWDVGAGRPHFSIPDVVATRGDHAALVIVSIAYEDGNRTELLHLQHVDRASRPRRIEQFDLDDVEAATTQLDRLDAAHCPLVKGAPWHLRS